MGVGIALSLGRGLIFIFIDEIPVEEYSWDTHQTSPSPTKGITSAARR